jgi:class 3 adenylate cyclase/tetratricopeptide (TPR) repeat protein
MPTEQVTGERRPVTALFVDVVGSTSLAELMDPEDWAMTMERAMAIMTGAVERYEGWVASHTGDGFMGLFGLPIAHEDDPARAVSAALEMIEGVNEFASELRSGGVEFRIRVGINSGEVVVRDADGGVSRDSRIYGDTLNVAARMESAAPPGGILITEATHRRLSGVVEARHIGPVSVKGKAEPVEAYEVLGRSGTLRSRRGITGLVSPMVGRETELGQLTGLLDLARAGIGRMAVVVGEPGIGKSRLLRELRHVALAKGFDWAEARTASYGRNLPLHLAIDLARALTGLPDPIESIPADEASERLSLELRTLADDDAAEIGPILRHLLSLPLEEPEAERIARMEPHTLRLRYTEAITGLVTAAGRSRPLVIVFDDVHWADEASVELLQPMLALVPRHSLLSVIASRAERDAPGWRFVSAAQEAYGDGLVDVRLRPLDIDDGQRLVANLLEIESLPISTRETILRRAEGNPLFVEEIIRMLIDGGSIEHVDGRWVATSKVRDVEIPESLHGLLLARIDRLPADARRILRIASVIGRTFGPGVLSRVAGGPAEEGSRPSIGQSLGQLEGAGLISLVGSAPAPEYGFRHALIQDAAYASLLKQERRALHLEVAQALLEMHPADDGEMAAVLAHHFELAEDRERALEYLVLAARHASSRFARHEAVDFARRGVELLPQDDEISAPERALRAELCVIQVQAGGESKPLKDSLALLERAVVDAEALRDHALSARAYLLMARARAMSGEQYRTSPSLARTLEQATALAEASESADIIAAATLSLAQAHYAASEFTTAVELLERAIPALIETGQAYHASVGAGQLGTAYGHLGDFDKAVAWTDRAYELGMESGDPNASLDADLGRAIVEGIRGETATAIEYATKAAVVAERVDNKACALVAHTVIGEQHLRDGHAEQAAISFQASADLATYCQFMPVKIEQTELLLQTARARTGVGHVEFERYERTLETARAVGDRLAEAQIYEQRAGDRLEAGQEEAAAGDLVQAQRLFETLGAQADLQRVREMAASLSWMVQD